jgi:cell division protein FtsI (penicillin-binding protein 3)
MAKPATRLAFLRFVLALGALVVVGRAFAVQVVQHDAWAARATERDLRLRDVPARRGGIYDRRGVTLAATYEAYHVKIAVNELADVAEMRRLITRALGVPAATVARQFRGPYPYFDGPFDAAQVEPIRGRTGVHLEPLLAREYPMGLLARPLIGRIDRENGHGIEGIELGFDSLLTGEPGKERYWRDRNGREVEIPGATVVEPRPGLDVLLTIDHELQGIAEGALRGAVEQFEALGGDVVILDAKSGEVLALASLRTPPGGGVPEAGIAALLAPQEPGSTAKIFTAGAVLAAGRAEDTAWVSGEGGEWRQEVATGHYRSIIDTHREDGLLGLARTIQVSSNIAISKFALRLSGEEQYTTLRAFGFGTAPGTGFPGESPGRLVRPALSPNLRYTQPSWAQGYEFSVTSLQMAAAYAALANGGHVVQPTLVREVRAWPSGEVVWRHRPDTLRRALNGEVTARLIDFLRLASDSGGTGTGAQLDRWEVIGKTGTAKLSLKGGEYIREYRGAFAGLFPGDDPRFVVYVMIDQPGGAVYYGGLVAAPIVRNLLVQALALPNSPLDPGRVVATSAITVQRAAPQPDGPPRRFPFPMLPDSTPAESFTVPDVTGWTVSDAVHAAHRRGLRVRLVGEGHVTRTVPAAGDSIPAGATLTIHAGQR